MESQLHAQLCLVQKLEMIRLCFVVLQEFPAVHWEFSALGPTLVANIEVKKGAGDDILTLLAAKVLQVKVREEMISVSKKGNRRKTFDEMRVRTVKYKYSAMPFQGTSPCI